MRYLSYVAAAIVVTASTPSLAQQIPDKVQPQPVTLTGCVAAGEKPNTYVLTHITSSADVIGTSGTPIYWLSPAGKLKGHVGQKVDISGTLEKNVDRTKVKEKDGSVEVKGDGKAVKVPARSSAAAALPPPGAKDPGFKVKVKSVTTLADSCR